MGALLRGGFSITMKPQPNEQTAIIVERSTKHGSYVYRIVIETSDVRLPDIVVGRTLAALARAAGVL